MSKICVKCGRVMNDRANFCMSCGSSEFRAANGGRRVSPARPAIRKDDLRPAEAAGEIRAVEAVREAGDSSLALGMTGAQQAGEAAVENAESAVGSAVEGADNPSVASGDSSTCTGEPEEAPREEGDSSLAPGMTEAAGEAAVEEPVDANSITFVYAEKHVEEPVEQDVPEPKKSRKGLWIAIAAVVLALGLAAVVLFVWPGFLSGK